MANLLKEVKLDLLSNVDVLLMVEKSIRGGICHSELIINTWKTMIKIKNLQIFNIGMKITYMIG